MIVVAAVIRDKAGKVLLTRRPEGVHMGGLWEFPGGKVEPGEAPEAALVRELEEELGLSAVVGRPVTFAVYEEPGKRILLLFYETVAGQAPPHAREGQEVAWVAPSDLVSYPTPPADRELVERLVEDSRLDRELGRDIP
jgi:8-oxo-dGTP diphosphatase